MKKYILYTLLSLLLLGSFIIFGVIGVYKTENGIVLGLPDYERRDVRVTPVDLEILSRADALLHNESAWRKAPVPDCAQSEKLDLYCALERASVEVIGHYVHRQPALQEVRFAIDDRYRARWTKHRLIDFNADKATSFEEVKSILEQATSTVKAKLSRYKNQQ
ncbi:DUF6197 family protein [Sulfurimonas diazotrophicus]|uniref:DUF1499 domain-containing protein n=1 Tax=Sulfurimonas diazotrophicus TaxID=3131939 RepID=A0ABZ3HBI4_9BACT